MDSLPPPVSEPPAFEAPASSEARPLKLGAGSFLFSGGPAGGYVGATAFLMSEWGRGAFVRPSLLVGESTGTTARSTLGAARVDACARLDGNYRRGNGIALDLCGGLEGGWAVVQAGDQAGQPSRATGLPLFDLGPSLDLRAELDRLAITTRLVAGFDPTGASYVDATGARFQAPAWPFRFELAISWDLAEGAATTTVATR